MLYSEILAKSAAALNDTARSLYTDAVLLPYLNMALAELEEEFELNNVPVTNETSETITVPTGIDKIGFVTAPALPSDLIEIQELFESVVDQGDWIPITKRESLTPSIQGNVELTVFGIWAWIKQQIHVRAAINDIDIKIDYIRSIFPELTISNINLDNPVINSDTYLFYKTAGLASLFIGENESRASLLDGKAGDALDRSLGISVKARQSMPVRRRPFRANLKSRRTLI